ncbi:type I restriction-modification system specificity subunit [Methanosarcina mazei]|uniref:Type I restriction-modification system specificity subunit n=1 Tax=Methanosarcina mazei TaxID=2209 RepID=A0A0F8GI72_METMZ|nr:restriction endonuclease subunit S [Methanosarcina mazei]KKG31946.1 type I restriction-modification system specificity subunit [Methanosarcina mazei]KKG38340.1 type I restriction-modification system specificity subunit [Methanosarcina mazei]KKG38878.1 type I restriction-modification system specificity subunit [Methanosarcina mazei]KKG39111.1 type I restriction-modification system specificity subunit [Methanosarcina mazei]KKG52064.1 type I restriction-modification system specificity subunit 
MEFTKRTLGDICDEVKGIVQTGPFGSQLHKSDYKDEGIPVVMPKNIIEDKISIEEIARIGKKDVERLSQHKLQKGDIVYGRRGDIGRRALIKGEQAGWLCGTGCIKISLKNASILEPSFLYYYLGQPEIVSWIYNQAIGATMPNLNTSIIRSIPITYPSLTTQKKIAYILSSYDDLIENNTRRIEILEQMAKLAYEEWFVKFRFPGHENVKMVPSDLGEIPKRWKVREVSEILKRFKAGKKYTQDNVLEEGLIPVIDQSEKEILGFHNDIADHSASLKNPIMIFGDHTCKIKILIEPFSVGPNVIPFRSEDYPEIFVFFLIKNLVQTKEYKRHWNELQAKRVVLPDVPLAMDFVNVVNPLFKQITLLEHKNQNLRKTRDLLLPKLISGEIDVSDLDIHIRNGVQES